MKARESNVIEKASEKNEKADHELLKKEPVLLQAATVDKRIRSMVTNPEWEILSLDKQMLGRKYPTHKEFLGNHCIYC
ncbi:hypothetical protein CEXT_620011 [Caerostris extrusa]|uniref:Uncharacterized protein n=1 Tax=Caerostris extrusa TaxID=172846 RepID=A0AAV4SAR6_CAEEX|nr:hypothetical protein CEXT_620011 [Caerostris extrusa]